MPTVFVSKIPGSRFRGKQLKIVVKTSGDHLLIQDSSRLSTEMSGILRRKTAVDAAGWRKILHTRNQHLRNHRGSSVAFSNGLSVAFSNRISLLSASFQRIVSCQVEFYWNSPMDCQ